MEKIKQAADYIGKIIDKRPEIGIITGTGLSGITDIMEIDHYISYEEIPHFPEPTVAGHPGNLLFGAVESRPVIAMQGRFHLYEGYTVQEVVFPARVMAKLGVKYLFIASAAGGLNPDFRPGELMIIKDHINLTGENPLMGDTLEEVGSRFIDMTAAYDKFLINMAREKAVQEGILLNQGIYVGITGPSLETPAETRFLRLIGGDAVGMSTVNKVIASVHSGLKVLAVAAVTNVNLPDCMKPTSIEEVISNAQLASPLISRLFRAIIKDL